MEAVEDSCEMSANSERVSGKGKKDDLQSPLRSNSPSPQKGVYHIQKDQLRLLDDSSPNNKLNYLHSEAETGHVSDCSISDSDDSAPLQGPEVTGKGASYANNSNDDRDNEKEDDKKQTCEDSDINDEVDKISACKTKEERSDVVKNEQLIDDYQHSYVDARSANDESSDEDEDEFFDASAGDPEDVLLPDPPTLAEEDEDPGAEPPPPPTTPLPVLQAIHPDIIDKYSLSQGWIERVNKSLVESSFSQNNRSERNKTSPPGGDAAVDSQDTGENRLSETPTPRHALLDHLHKSSSDNRHDRSSPHSFPRQKPQIAPRTLFGLASSSQDSSLSSASPWRRGSSPADSISSSATNLRRSAYVSALRCKDTGKPSIVGYRPPASSRPRTASYMRAVSRGNRPSSEEERLYSVGGEGANSILGLKQENSASCSVLARTGIPGTLVSAWSSVPTFSRPGDKEATVLSWSRPYKYTPSSRASMTNITDVNSPTLSTNVAVGQYTSDIIKASQRRSPNRTLPLILKTQYPRAYKQNFNQLKDPDLLQNSNSVQSVREDTTKFETSCLQESSAPGLRSDENAPRSDPVSDTKPTSCEASSGVNAQPSGNSGLDITVAPVQDSSNSTKRRKVPEYELLLDAENDVMRVNNLEPHGLMRKPAVRRKGVKYHSKTLPRNTGSSLNKRRRQKEDSTPQSKGSSLDLAPSLLNIYDDIIASASKDDALGGKDAEDGNGEEGIDIENSYGSIDNTRSTSAANPTSPSSPNHEARHTRGTPGVHLRAGSGGKQQLPSLSVPPDRPVSMAEAESLGASTGASHGSRSSVDKDAHQKKKRPLSMSSGSVSSSSPSVSSLSRARRKRANVDFSGNGSVDIEEDIIPEDSIDEISNSSGRRAIRKCNGRCAEAKAASLAGGKTSSLMISPGTQSTLFSESRNSVDSGCVLHGDGSIKSRGGAGSRSSAKQGGKGSALDKGGNNNDDGGEGEGDKRPCSCYCYNDSMSVSSSDTAGSGSLSYRDDVDSSTSSIREGSALQLASGSSTSSSSSSLTPAGSRHDVKDSSREGPGTHRNITGLPIAIPEGYSSSSIMNRRFSPHSPSSLPLGHHYPNYQPLDERLATSPDASSKTFGHHFSPGNDSGFSADRGHNTFVASSPGSLVSTTSPRSPQSFNNNTSVSSTINDSSSIVPSSPDYNSSSNNSSTKSNNSARRSSSFSKSEARKRFFSNYEEHMRQMEEDQQRPQHESEKSPSQETSVAQAETSAFSSERIESGLPEEATGGSLKSEHYYNENSSSALPERMAADNASPVSPSSSPLSELPPTPPTHSASQHKKHSPTGMPSSPSSTSTAHRISSHGFPSKSTKKKESGSSAGEGPGKGVAGTSGYVSYVQRVVAEILDSERTYIASLEDIIHGYLEPMEQILGSTDASEDLACLFGNIREIYKFGCQFLADLEMTSLDPVQVAQCFVKHNKGFVIYTDYCTNYPRAVEVLTRFMQHPELSELCKERQLALGHGLPLGAYLLRPVQRILKYHLLLQNIVKNCEKEAGGSGSSERSARGSTSSTISSGSGSGSGPTILEQAFQHMTQMASHINEMKRKHEHAVRIQEIQSQLEDYVGEDLTRLGDLVLESTFRVYGAKASRQVFLFERGLLISKKKEGGMLSCKTFIRCSNLMLVEVIPNEPLSFHTIPFDNPRAQYTLQARNMEQKRRWCQEMKRLILESYKSKIPDNVKSLVMQLGRNHDDDYVSKEALEAAKKNQHTAPEYLEKRRFRRKSGPRLPDFSLLKPQRAKKGVNKKGDNKGPENSKLSPELTRRAESKSPDSHRKFLIRQNAKKRSQSQTASLPSTPITEPTYLELFDQTSRQNNNNSPNQASTQTSTPKRSGEEKVLTSGDKSPKGGRHRNHPKLSKLSNSTSSPSLSRHAVAALIPSQESLLSPISSDARLEPDSYARTDQDCNSVEMDNVEAESENGMITKRATSFRKAMRAHPITSADFTELVVRCGGGSIHMPSMDKPTVQTPASTDQQNSQGEIDVQDNFVVPDWKSGKEEGTGLDILESSSSILRDFLNSSLVSRSDLEDFDENDDEYGEDVDDNTHRDDLRSQITQASRAISNGDFTFKPESGLDEQRHDKSDFNGEALTREKPLRSASLPLLDDSMDDEVNITSENSLNGDNIGRSSEAEKCSSSKTAHQTKNLYKKQHYSVEDVCGESEGAGRNHRMGRGRMSRRDLQDAAAQIKKRYTGISDRKNKNTTNRNKTGKNEKKGTQGSNIDLPPQNGDATSGPMVDSASEKNVLLRSKRKGLRLPNTHKHLSVQDYTSMAALEDRSQGDGSKAKLIGWSSADKLTKGSMVDVSHLTEDPWVRNTDTISDVGANTKGKKDRRISLQESRGSKGSKPQLSRASASASHVMGARPRGNSDLTDMSVASSRVSGSKENLDWLVYLNRNKSGSAFSLSSPSSTQTFSSQTNISLSPSSAIPSHTPSVETTDPDQNSSSIVPKGGTAPHLSAIPHVSPHHSSKASENMHTLCSPSSVSTHMNSDANGEKSRSHAVADVPSSLKQIALVRPVKLHEASNLSRSNSLPTASSSSGGMPSSGRRATPRHRRASTENVDQPSARESAQQMVAEMEAYITSIDASPHGSGRHLSVPSRFPTSLPTITVEEEAADYGDEDDDDDSTRPPGSNRLSVISSVSTSSYESQGSWSSGASDDAEDGLVGTLRHKLHAWAKDSEELERKDSCSDSSTINNTSSLVDDNDNSREYPVPAVRSSSLHSKLSEGVKSSNNISTSAANQTARSGSKTEKEGLKEERQLESVLREHSLGSSSIGSRMANTMPYASGPPGVSACTASTQSPQKLAQESEHYLCNESFAKHSKSEHNAVAGRVGTSVCDVSISLSEGVRSNANNTTTSGNISTNSTDPLLTRFSLPPTKEATEALMPPGLTSDGCEIQQSDSGFSLQSTVSSSSDSNCSPGDSKQTPPESPEVVGDAIPTSQSEESKTDQLCPEARAADTDPVPTASVTSSQPSSEKGVIEGATGTASSRTVIYGMKRCDSCGSIDSTDSFYERRLSVAFESDVFNDLPTAVKVIQDLPYKKRSVVVTATTASQSTTMAGQESAAATKTTVAAAQQALSPSDAADAETPLSRKSIKEYVQSIEEMFKPQSPKVIEVRRREPGTMIRQKLQTLRDQVVHGRRDSSEERGYGYARSKSQPPSQHRSTLLTSSSLSSVSSLTSGDKDSTSGGILQNQQRSSDDMLVNSNVRLSGSRDSLSGFRDTHRSSNSSAGLTGSRDNLSPLKNKPHSMFWGSRESVFMPSTNALISKSRERLCRSKEQVHGSRESLSKDKRSASTDVYRPETLDPAWRAGLLSSPVFARKDLSSKHDLYNYPHNNNSGSSSSIAARVAGHEQNAVSRSPLCSSSSHHPQEAPVDHWGRDGMNQFVHRAGGHDSHPSLLEHSPSPDKPRSITPDRTTKGVKSSASFSYPSPLERPHHGQQHQQPQHSRSMCRLDQLSTEVDNLVIMKGWVRSLISKFQDQP